MVYVNGTVVVVVFERSVGLPNGCFEHDTICSGSFTTLLLLRICRRKAGLGFVAATMLFNRGNI